MDVVDLDDDAPRTTMLDELRRLGFGFSDAQLGALLAQCDGSLEAAANALYDGFEPPTKHLHPRKLQRVSSPPTASPLPLLTSPSSGPSTADISQAGWYVQLAKRWRAYSMLNQIAIEYAWWRGDQSVIITVGSDSFTLQFSADSTATQIGSSNARSVRRVGAAAGSASSSSSSAVEPPMLAAVPHQL